MAGTKLPRAVPAAILAVIAILSGCTSPAQARPPAPAASSATAVPARDYLSAASCVSRTFCVAAGSNFGTGRSLAESWNGRQWRVMHASGVTTRLSSVSCTSTSFCMAVGEGAAQLWDGRRWWAVRTPFARLNMLAVSCARRSSCLAVGNQAAQVWNGTFWKDLTLPRSGLALDSVACLTATFCMAVGSRRNHVGTISLSRALIWDGTTWRATHPPSPGSFAALSGVACLSRWRCLAVGWRGHCRQAPQPLGPKCFFSLRWDGRAWTQLGSPASTPLEASVACGAKRSCLAAGDCNFTANCRGTTVLAWNGRTWRKQVALAPGRHGTSLEGVACWRRPACIVTGGAVSSSGALLSLAEAWDGRRWQLFATASPAR